MDYKNTTRIGTCTDVYPVHNGLIWLCCPPPPTFPPHLSHPEDHITPTLGPIPSNHLWTWIRTSLSTGSRYPLLPIRAYDLIRNSTTWTHGYCPNAPPLRCWCLGWMWSAALPHILLSYPTHNSTFLCPWWLCWDVNYTNTRWVSSYIVIWPMCHQYLWL